MWQMETNNNRNKQLIQLIVMKKKTFNWRNKLKGYKVQANVILIAAERLPLDK